MSVLEHYSKYVEEGIESPGPSIVARARADSISSRATSAKIDVSPFGALSDSGRRALTAFWKEVDE